MTDYIYHEVPVTRGKVVSISDSVNPCHIKLVETDDGPFVKWLEPVASQRDLDLRLIDLRPRGSTREVIASTEIIPIAQTGGVV